jgi:hypothetical protein
MPRRFCAPPSSAALRDIIALVRVPARDGLRAGRLRSRPRPPSFLARSIAWTTASLNGRSVPAGTQLLGTCHPETAPVSRCSAISGKFMVETSSTELGLGKTSSDCRSPTAAIPGSAQAASRYSCRIRASLRGTNRAADQTPVPKIALSTKQVVGETARKFLNHAMRPHGFGRAIEAEGRSRERSETYLSHGAAGFPLSDQGLLVVARKPRAGHCAARRRAR